MCYRSFDLDTLSRVERISKGRRATNTVKCEALKYLGPTEIQGIRDAFANVVQGVCNDMDVDDLPKEVTDKSIV